MKHLTEFLAEAMQTQAEQNNDSKTITFDFNGIEESENFLKELPGKAQADGTPVSVDGTKVTLSLTADIIEKSSDTIEYIKDFIKSAGKSQKRASDEQYAQRLQVLESALEEMDEFATTAKDEQDAEAGKNTDDNKDDKKDDKKEDE